MLPLPRTAPGQAREGLGHRPTVTGQGMAGIGPDSIISLKTVAAVAEPVRLHQALAAMDNRTLWDDVRAIFGRSATPGRGCKRACPNLDLGARMMERRRLPWWASTIYSFTPTSPTRSLVVEGVPLGSARLGLAHSGPGALPDGNGPGALESDQQDRRCMLACLSYNFNGASKLFLRSSQCFYTLRYRFISFS